MKELDIVQLLKERTKTEIQQEKQQEYQLVYQNTIIPHEGHILYEIDIATQEIVEAEFIQKDYVFKWSWKPGDRIPVHSEVVIQPGKVYVSALNKRNALKKFKKESNGTKIDITKTYLNL